MLQDTISSAPRRKTLERAIHVRRNTDYIPEKYNVYGAAHVHRSNANAVVEGAQLMRDGDIVDSKVVRTSYSTSRAQTVCVRGERRNLVEVSITPNVYVGMRTGDNPGLQVDHGG